MGSTSVRVENATQAGRLYPDYNASSGILTLANPQVGQCPLGLNIDDLVIIDADSNGLVRQIEVLIPRRKWVVRELSPRRSAPEGDLYLADDSRDAWDGSPVVAWVSAPGDRMELQIGEPSPHAAEAVSLSPSVVALIRNTHLVGLQVDLVASEQ